MRAPVTQAVILCTLVGLLGGAILMALGRATVLSGVVLGGLYGAVFGLLAAPRAATPGAGLLWGLGYALLLWLAGPAGLFARLNDTHAMGMLDTARAHFPALLGSVLCFGLPLGIALGLWGARHADQQRARFSLPRALVVGALAGVIGGWAFGRWMEQINFFPIIAGLIHSWRRASINSSQTSEVLNLAFQVRRPRLPKSDSRVFERELARYSLIIRGIHECSERPTCA